MSRSLPVTVELDGKPVHVGTIVKYSGEATRFEISESYIDMGPSRPTLSLSWLDTRGDEATIARLRHSGDKLGLPRRLPDWFAGLLPEGALRELVDKEIGNGSFGDFEVIERLGGDLPGAVRVGDRVHPPSPAEQGRIHFSLSGVQLKFVGELEGGRITFPASGMGGHYIVKTPSAKYPDLVELEHLAMVLISAVGVDIAETSLLPSTEVAGIPPEYLESGSNVLVSRRFDRVGDRRVHMEDFAQIANAINDLKYTRGSYSVVMKMVQRFSTDPLSDLDQMVRRTVANVLVGNGDAHLKNWSFLMNEGQRRLSPSYDVVPTWCYGDKQLGIPLGGQKRIDEVRLVDILRTAHFAGLSRERTIGICKDVVETALRTWPQLIDDSDLKPNYGTALVNRLNKLELTHDILSEELGSSPSVALF